MTKNLLKEIEDVINGSDKIKTTKKGSKYEFTGESKIVDGVKVYRIRYRNFWDYDDLEDGDLGGFIESEKNLDTSDAFSCWVYNDAVVYGDAKVTGDAKVRRNAKVYGGAEIRDDATVEGNAEVYDRSIISESARIGGNAKVHGRVQVRGHASIRDNAEVSKHSEVSENATVAGNAKVENSVIYGDAYLYGTDYIVDKEIHNIPLSKIKYT